MIAHSEFAGTENTANFVALLDRAVIWFAQQSITIERILSDSGKGDRSIGKLGGSELAVRERIDQKWHGLLFVEAGQSIAAARGQTPN